MKKTILKKTIAAAGFIAGALLVTSGVHAQIINTIAGDGVAGFAGDGGPATAARLRNPINGKFDATGNYYFADYNNHRIRKINTSGVISTVAGTGAPSFSGDGGAATAAGLNSPVGVAVDGSGNVYFSDRANTRIRMISASGTITTVAGTGGVGYTGDGGAATAATLNYPGGINVDASGNVYFADESNNVVRKITVSTGVISTVAGNGTAGYSGDLGAATSAKLDHPKDVVVKPTGEIYIADYANSRIRRVNSSGNIATVVGTGTAGFSGDGGSALSAQINHPLYVWADTASGDLLFTDAWNNRVRKVNAAGTISTIAGNGTYGYSGDAGAATAAKIANPSVTTDASGAIYLCDEGNDRIRKITPAPPSLSGFQFVCDAGDTTIFVSTVSGGTWSSSDVTIATVDAAGIITGVAPGSALISYTASSGVGTRFVTVSATPAISGTYSVCVGATTALSASIPGGVWASLSTATATVDASGLVTGVAADTVSIGYIMTSTACYAVKIVTVDPCIPTSVETVDASSMEVYPNPASESIVINLPANGMDLVVTDVLGKLVFSKKSVVGKTLNCDLSPFPSGNYVVKAMGNGLVYRKKIVVQK
ncbi:MAG: T9SS type A sorting domain-containing protein [Taibaiella sp.]|nr:T9SS type A sorting domain-containing protein [Taibaiella sp.]